MGAFSPLHIRLYVGCEGKGKVTPGFGFEQLEKWNCHLSRWGSLREEQIGEGRNLVLDVL